MKKKRTLTNREMLAITAAYPPSLRKKDAGVDAIVKNIQDGITALKTKGENNETELKNIQTQIKSLSSKRIQPPP
jgi:peptidoglycan hydrolase CwlO-like protein